MIFVTVGTHEQQFNRLIKEVDELKGNGSIKDDVFMQIGYSTYEPKYCQWKKLISYDEMNQMYENADIIITHGGPASFMKALELKKIPIVVPRQAKFDEHINDHQVEFVKFLDNHNYDIHPVYDIQELRNYIQMNNKSLLNIQSNNFSFNNKLMSIIDHMVEKTDDYRTINLLFYFQMVLCLFQGLFLSVSSKLSFIGFAPDIISLINILLIFKISHKSIKMSFKNKPDLILMSIFLLYVFVSVAWSDFSYVNILARLRFIFVGFLTYFMCRNFINTYTVNKIIKLCFFTQIANFVLVFIQCYVFKLHPDFCNGIFGFTEYNNGIEGLFCLIIVTLSLLYYLDNKMNLKSMFLFLLISCAIAAMAEIKVFFVLFILDLILIFILNKKNKRQYKKYFLIGISSILLLLFSYLILKIVLPDNLSTFFNLNDYFHYESRSDFAGRLNTISFIIDTLFKHNIFYIIFGTGLGSNHSNYIYELGKLFSEQGFFGLFLLISCFVAIFCMLYKKEGLRYKTFTYVYILMIIISIVVWNCLFTRYTYIVFFFLGLFSNYINAGEKYGE